MNIGDLIKDDPAKEALDEEVAEPMENYNLDKDTAELEELP